MPWAGVAVGVIVGAVLALPSTPDAFRPVDGDVVVPTVPPAASATEGQLDDPQPSTAPLQLDCQPADCVVWTRRPFDVPSEMNLGTIAEDPDSLTVFANAAVAMIDAATGAVRWQRTFPGPIGATSARDGMLFIESAGTAYLVAAANGRDLWTVPSAGDLYGDLFGDGVVLTADPSSPDTGSLIARSVDDGRPQWRWTPERRTDLTDLYVERSDDAGVLVRTTPGAQLIMLDADTGGVRWRRDGARSLSSIAGATAVLVDTDAATQVDPTGEVTDAPTTLTGVSLDDGTTAWRRRLPITQPTSIRVRSDAVVFASTQRLTALDLASGDIRWAVPTTEPEQLAFDTASPDDGNRGPVITVGQHSGLLRARDLGTGNARWRQPFPPQPATFVFSDGTLVTAQTRNDIQILAAATGASMLQVTTPTPLPGGSRLPPLIEPSPGFLVRLRLPDQ